MHANRFIAIAASRHYSPFAVSLERNGAEISISMALASVSNLASDMTAVGLLAKARNNPEILSPAHPLLPKEVVAKNLSYRAGLSLPSVTLTVTLHQSGEIRASTFDHGHIVPDGAVDGPNYALEEETLWQLCSQRALYRQRNGFCAHADQEKGWLLNREGLPEAWTNPSIFRSRLILREVNALVEECAAAYLASHNVPHIRSGRIAFVRETEGSSRYETTIRITGAGPEVWANNNAYPERPAPIGWIGDDIVASLNQYQLESTLSAASNLLDDQSLKQAIKLIRNSRDWLEPDCHGPRLSRSQIGAMIANGALCTYWDELGNPGWRTVEPFAFIRDGFVATVTKNLQAVFLTPKIVDGILEWFSIEQCAPFAPLLLDVAASFSDAPYAILLRWHAVGALVDLQLNSSQQHEGTETIHTCVGSATTPSGRQVTATVRKGAGKETKWEAAYQLLQQLLEVGTRPKPLASQTTIPKRGNPLDSEIRTLETEIRRVHPARIAFRYSEDAAGHGCIARTGPTKHPVIGTSAGHQTPRKARAAALRDLLNVCLGKASNRAQHKTADASNMAMAIRQRWEHELSARVIEGREMDQIRTVALRRFLAQTAPGRMGHEQPAQKELTLLNEEIAQRQSMTTPSGRFATGVKLVQTLFSSVPDVQFNDHTQRLAIRLGILRDEIAPLLLDTGLVVREGNRLLLTSRGRRATRREGDTKAIAAKQATLADAVDPATLSALLSAGR